ncbi:MAG: M12 family metallopeptidase [Myxococcota bacterium]|jgi:hypothetical protein|nr:M12 family metallopeptidase [Myxococcota bacterium]
MYRSILRRSNLVCLCASKPNIGKSRAPAMVFVLSWLTILLALPTLPVKAASFDGYTDKTTPTEEIKRADEKPSPKTVETADGPWQEISAQPEAETKPYAASGLITKPLIDSAVKPKSVHSETFQTPFGPFTLEYELVDGVAYVQGDIIVNLDKMRRHSAETMKSYGHTPPGSAGYATTVSGLAAVASREELWPNANVPFVIDQNLPNPGRVQAAIAHWQANTPLRFVPRSREDDFIVFVPDDDRCASAVGRDGGRQEIMLAPAPTATVPGCGQLEVIHEIGHAVGLFHEQSREDRDEYVVIDLSNVPWDEEHNFAKYSDDTFLWWGGHDGQDLGPYDFASSMHYPSIAFAQDPSRPTIRRRNGCSGANCLIPRNTTGLSTNDKRYVHELYCPLIGWNNNRCATYLDPAEGPTFRIVVRDVAEKCLDVTSGSLSPMAQVNAYTCHTGNNQLWQLQPDPLGTGSFYIRAKHSGLCLDVPNGSTGFVPLQQHACHGGSNQKFILADVSSLSRGSGDYSNRWHPEFLVKPLHSRMCLGKNWRNQIIQTDCRSLSAKSFRLEVREFPFELWDIASVDNGQCIDVPGGRAGSAALQTWTCHGGESQAFKFLPRPNGTFALQNKASGECVSMSPRGDVEQSSCGSPGIGTSENRFWINVDHSGEFDIRGGYPMNCIGAFGATDLDMAGCDWQRDFDSWQLIPRK